MKKITLALVGISISVIILGQQTKVPTIIPHKSDSLPAVGIIEKKHLPKIDHAEPLYIDLIRDLGARKGEQEWNFGFEMKDNLRFDQISALVEYEFAPIDRLGFEVELPFNFYTSQQKWPRDSLPGAGLNSIKAAVQWTFLVSPKAQTSMALGYIHEALLPSFREMKGLALNGHLYNPFVVLAKKWSKNWHSLLYTGPLIEKLHDHSTQVDYAINSNVHYMIPGSRNFVGIEVNKEIGGSTFSMVLRPQMRLGITNNLLLGIVGGIPIKKDQQRMSMFTRLIWEPRHK